MLVSGGADGFLKLSTAEAPAAAGTDAEPDAGKQVARKVKLTQDPDKGATRARTHTGTRTHTRTRTLTHTHTRTLTRTRTRARARTVRPHVRAHALRVVHTY